MTANGSPASEPSPITPEQAEVLRWLFSPESPNDPQASVRQRFAAVGWLGPDDVERSLAAHFASLANAPEASS